MRNQSFQIFTITVALLFTANLNAQESPDFAPQVVARACQYSQIPNFFWMKNPAREKGASAVAYPAAISIPVYRGSLPDGRALEGLDFPNTSSNWFYGPPYPYNQIGYTKITDLYWAGEAFTTYYAPLDGPSGKTRFWVWAAAKVFVKNARGKWGVKGRFSSEWMSNPSQSEIFDTTRTEPASITADYLRSILFRARAGTGNWPSFFIYILETLRDPFNVLRRQHRCYAQLIQRQTLMPWAWECG